MLHIKHYQKCKNFIDCLLLRLIRVKFKHDSLIGLKVIDCFVCIDFYVKSCFVLLSIYLQI